MIWRGSYLGVEGKGSEALLSEDLQKIIVK